MATYEIPLSATNQSFAIDLGGVTYTLTFIYRAPAGWVLDIAGSEGVALVSGIPLVTGADLLGQYAHLGLKGALRVVSEDGLAPSFDALGSTTKLYWTDAT